MSSSQSKIEHIICKNCGYHFNDHFCSKCGQSAHTERIDFKYFIHDIPHSVFHIDKGFFFTLKAMVTRPGLAIKEYLEGKRINHFRPFGFVILLSTICTILLPLFDKIAVLILKHRQPNLNFASPHHFWEKYISLLILILVPILSLVTYLTYRDKKYNYWEHFLGNAYIAAFLNVLLIVYKIFGVLKLGFGGEYNTNIAFFMFLYMFYYSYVFKKWMAPGGSFAKEFLRLFVMNTFISLIYITALSLTNIMTPWWAF